jgi:hypothetical protein
MSSIEAALAAIESLKPSESMMLIAGRSHGDTSASQPHTALRPQINERYNPGRS